VRRSFRKKIASTAPNSGEVALRITEYDAGRCCAANEYSANGSAVLTPPRIR